MTHALILEEQPDGKWTRVETLEFQHKRLDVGFFSADGVTVHVQHSPIGGHQLLFTDPETKNNVLLGANGGNPDEYVWEENGKTRKLIHASRELRL